MDTAKAQSTVNNVDAEGAFTKKPSIRRKPVIRQTLTSMYRMAKANPLLWYESDMKLPPAVTNFCSINGSQLEAKINEDFRKESTLVTGKPTESASVIGGKRNLPSTVTKVCSVNGYQFEARKTKEDLKKDSTLVSRKPTGSAIVIGDKKKLPHTQTNFCKINGSQFEASKSKQDFKKQNALIRGQLTDKKKSSETVVNKNKNAVAVAKSTTNTLRNLHKQPLYVKKEKASVASNNKNIVTVTTNETDKKRISLTSEFRKKQQTRFILKKQTSGADNCLNGGLKRRSKSAEPYQPIEQENVLMDVRSVEDINKPTLFENPGSTIRRVTFKSPVMRRSRQSIVFSTPRCNNNNRASYYSSTPLLMTNELKKRLDQWLKKRGKSLSTFHHLKCFDMTRGNEMDDEDKENIETIDDSSYENLRIDLEPEKAGENQDYEAIAKDALHDLLKLIQDGYSQEQCEAWLTKIRLRHNNLDEEPQYWECRAALEQSRGNISAAVECYRTAIVKGAEVETVDQSLEQLLQKFSLLNISTEEATEESKVKARIVLDARNAFKSTIIQFAVQEKLMKKKYDDAKSKITVVTPVRRSARLSTSAATANSRGSGMKLCSSLKQLGKEELSFKNNSFLAARYAPN